ncbi:hypothetical protein LCGC14_2201610 [marine sediment metagenome]|uniref:Uncharacterized protein n=1 Tax=marine sediment metagenome TaxID=412755 RepID=A0A0F9DGJ5_9ZZZZ
MMDYQDWNSCEFYGHAYEVDEDNQSRHVCKDCGDSYEEVTNDTKRSQR